MIIVLSELKKLLPDLPASGQKLADTFSLIGHFCAGYQKVEGEEVYDLEIRAANRPDCLGYIGIARDLAAYYKINPPKLFDPDESPDPTIKSSENLKFKINVSAPHLVKTLRACKIIDLKIGPSPKWLQGLLTHHDINPINNLVDLTNYAMLLYGIPVHAFDAQKVNNQLEWCESKKGQTITTFDGTKLELQDGNLIIQSGDTPVSMSSIGGNNSGIDQNSTETILEVAIYDPYRVHQDNRALNIQTEAGSRLEKFLELQSLSTILHHLQKLVVEICSGKLTDEQFSFDNYVYTPPQIEFDPQLVSKFAGTNIPTETCYDILSRLDCQKNPDNTITPPFARTDINIQEDLIEEVIRIYGYDKITIEEPIDPTPKNPITPKIIELAESIKNILVQMGYDEIRSWPLVSKDNLLPELATGETIYAQNSINEEYPALRQTLISSLISQRNQYDRYKVPSTKFFEIGKIFNLTDGNYVEDHALGIYTDKPEDLQILEDKLQAKLTWTSYQNYHQAILTNILDFQEYKQEPPANNSYELTTQISELDATISLDSSQDSQKLIDTYTQKIDKNILFALVIKDYYLDPKTKHHNYTFTAWYYNCDSQTAKQTHLTAFNLK